MMISVQPLTTHSVRQTDSGTTITVGETFATTANQIDDAQIDMRWRTTHPMFSDNTWMGGGWVVVGRCQVRWNVGKAPAAHSLRF